MQDLRSFIASAEKAGELLRVHRETDPLTEMGVLFGETEHPLMFENVCGYLGQKNTIGAAWGQVFGVRLL